MTRLQLFTRLQLIPLLTIIILILLSFYNFYWGTYDPYWGPSYEVSFNMWTAVFPGYYDYIYSQSRLVSVIHFISIILAFFLFLFSGILVKKYIGFPSIKDANKYFRELKRVKKASLKAKAINEFQLKLAKLEEEKKKYL